MEKETANNLPLCRDSTCSIPEDRKGHYNIMTKTLSAPMISKNGDHIEHWKTMMRNFAAVSEIQCRSVERKLNIPRVELPTRELMQTGATYSGTCDVFGLEGYGTYTFATEDAVYEGGFHDGDFHGIGEMRYKNGSVLRGKWKNGILVEKHIMDIKLFFPDGVEYKDTDWKYCRMPDRRFHVEYENGLKPAGMCYKTAVPQNIEIPPGYYDVGDGFYDPVGKAVYKYDELTYLVRMVTADEHLWIISNCRKGPDVPLGPINHFYEQFCQANLEPQPTPKPPCASLKDVKHIYGFECCGEDAIHGFNKKAVNLSSICCPRK